MLSAARLTFRIHRFEILIATLVAVAAAFALAVLTLQVRDIGIPDACWPRDFEGEYGLPECDQLLSRFWDLEAGQMSFSLSGSDRSVGSVAFVNGNRGIVAGDSEGLHHWDLTYFDRHIAGNAVYWIERLRKEVAPGVDWDEVERWHATLAER